MNPDIYGNFLKAYQAGNQDLEVLLHNNYTTAEDFPVSVFFREDEDLNDIEVFALNLCDGKILDIGAGAGVHSLILQRNNLDVTALEISEGACEVMKKRGLRKIINANVMDYRAEKYDTLLMMMNGIGFCGYVDELRKFLIHAKNILKPSGQILFDSSDVSYLYEDEAPEPDSYYGEIDYQYEFNGEKGDWFSWLYADENLVAGLAKETGYQLQIMFRDDDNAYLGKLTLV
ncbi:class I SAM-dependent methyltransferase [Pedobacter sp. SD-b]|uniref:Class I SAM-dependent methyltransferase n=1 Tax=Pedobacter segetis TaxID=2793069 RepID=A0ABS1BFN9_9SPHI|nr:class I SAM-dependent methyltransferase [Pedobacter segetis]MBK0381640.1 class I SAM-dependent methyltransferase [Pedobacter segetis]